MDSYTMTPADMRAVTDGARDDGFGMGGGWMWIIVLFLFLFGFGGGGAWGNRGQGLTQMEMQQGFDTQEIVRKLDGINYGLCDGFYAQNTNVLNGFAGVNQSIMQNGYETRGAITDVGYALKDCCCQTQRAIDGVNYNLATQSCDTRRAIEDGTNRIIGFLTNEKIDSLRAENTALTAQLSQNAQTRALLDELRPVARPAYITCSPYQSVYGWGNGNACGCGCA